MRIALFLFAFLIAFLNAAEPFSHPLELGDNSAYMQLRRVAVDDLNHPKNNELIESIFFPIGWRNEQFFAYLTIPANEARDCEWAELHIQDLSTDKTLVNKEYELCPLPGKIPSPDQIDNDGLQTLLYHLQTRYLDDINRQLRQNGFKSIDSIPELKHFPIQFREYAFSYLLETSRRTQPDFSTVDLFLWRWNLRLTREKNGKVLSSKNIAGKQKNDSTLILELRVLGTFISPGRRRLAILLGTVERGWEGRPYITTFFIVGASLTKGWGKKQ